MSVLRVVVVDLVMRRSRVAGGDVAVVVVVDPGDTLVLWRRMVTLWRRVAGGDVAVVVVDRSDIVLVTWRSRWWIRGDALVLAWWMSGDAATLC
jgi:hypothetical protein